MLLLLLRCLLCCLLRPLCLLCLQQLRHQLLVGQGWGLLLGGLLKRLLLLRGLRLAIVATARSKGSAQQTCRVEGGKKACCRRGCSSGGTSITANCVASSNAAPGAAAIVLCCQVDDVDRPLLLLLLLLLLLAVRRRQCLLRLLLRRLLLRQRCRLLPRRGSSATVADALGLLCRLGCLHFCQPCLYCLHSRRAVGLLASCGGRLRWRRRLSRHMLLPAAALLQGGGRPAGLELSHKVLQPPLGVRGHGSGP